MMRCNGSMRKLLMMIRRFWVPLHKFGFALTLLAVSACAALAQDADEAHQPMDPVEKSEQLRSFGIIAAVIAIVIILYLVRRYQTIHGGKVVEGMERDDE